MKPLPIVVLCTGLLIQLAALTGEHAVEIPFVLRSIAPSYYHASRGMKKLSETEKLDSSDEGFPEIAQIITREYAPKFITKNGTNQTDEELSSSGFTVDNLKLDAAVRTGNRPVNPFIKVSCHFTFQLNDGEIAIYEQEMMNSVEETKTPNILYFCFGLFFFGSLLDITAFIVEKAEEKKKVADEAS